MGVYENIASLGITLPGVTPPVAALVPFVRSRKQVFLSGHIAKKNGKPWTGQLGQDLTTGQGKDAASSVAVDLIATLNLAAGDLNKIKRIVKLMVLVNSCPSFTEQHVVADGAPEVLTRMFGDNGKHRSEGAEMCFRDVLSGIRVKAVFDRIAISLNVLLGRTGCHGYRFGTVLAERVGGILLTLLLGAAPNGLCAADEAKAFIARGDRITAIQNLEADCEVAQKEGRRDRDVAANLNNLGVVYAELGRPREARIAYEKSMAMWRNLRKADTAEAATTMCNLGAVYTKLNLLTKAVQTLRNAAAIKQKLGGEIAATQVWINLAFVYKALGDAHESETLLRRTLEIREHELGPQDRGVALALNNLAVLLQEQKRISEAEPLLSRAVQIWETQVGPRPPLLATALHNLGTVRASLGEFSEAEANFKRAIEIGVAELPPGHPDLASYELSYAHLLRQFGRKSEARHLEESARTARRQSSQRDLTGYTVEAQQLKRQGAK